MVSSSSRFEIRVMGLDAIAFNSSVMVTTEHSELSEAVKFASVTS
jgi:hypothetical protein